MKPRVKNDSWYYTASTKSARRNIRRLARKRHREGDRKLTEKERNL